MKDIYTPQEAALEVIESRRQDPEVQARVAEYLGSLLPANCFEQERPVAILARYVPRATGEDRIFAERAEEAGFVPYWASYVADRFTTRNPEKVETIRPPIRWQKGQKTRSWIVEPEKRQGGIGELETTFGYASADYQQGIREIVLQRDGVAELADNTFDMGDWYKTQALRFGYTGGNLAPYYYPATMALATTFGALYEDFDGGPNAGNGDLAAFMGQVVYPAIDKVERELGLSPVIVRLTYQERMNETDLSFLDTDQAEQFKKFGSMSLLSGKVG
jgi:hypothetical protein